MKGFDLTYEGLKSGSAESIGAVGRCFDLTYEGLKLDFSLYILQRLFVGFDLTYEGLKPTKQKNRACT